MKPDWSGLKRMGGRETQAVSINSAERVWQ